MRIGGLQKLTLIDYPGRMAATVFAQGCNMRCPFCHNPELVRDECVASSSTLQTDAVLGELEARRGFLDAVVVTGGEPTLQHDLLPFLEDLRRMGLLIKLDTNGLRPDVLEELLGQRLVDYVAMDLKSSFERYAEFAGVPVGTEKIKRSMVLTRTAPAYEFRTTVAPGLSLGDLRSIMDGLQPADAYFLQVFRVPDEKGLVDPQWAERRALSSDELAEFWREARDSVAEGGIRD